MTKSATVPELLIPWMICLLAPVEAGAPALIPETGSLESSTAVTVGLCSDVWLLASRGVWMLALLASVAKSAIEKERLRTLELVMVNVVSKSGFWY